MGVAQSLDAPLWATLPTDARVVEQVYPTLPQGREVRFDVVAILGGRIEVREGVF